MNVPDDAEPRPSLAFISTVHPSPPRPGTGRFNAVLLRGLATEWNVSAWIPVPWREWQAAAAPPAASAGYPLHHFRYWYLPGSAGRASQGALLHRQLRRVAATMPRPDLILSYWAYPDADAAGRLAADLGVPSAVIIGGSDLLVQARDPRHRTRVLAAIARHQQVFAVGEDLRQRIIDSGVAASRVGLLERGVDRVHFHPGDRMAARRQLDLPGDRPVVLWVGRMEPVKDLETLVRAVGSIPGERRPLLVLVGEGREATRVSAWAADSAVEVRQPGALAPKRLGDWYRAADLFALSSRSEGTPNVLLEAIASGLPFVTTRVGGAAILADRHGMAAVPAGDPSALAHAIVRQLASNARPDPGAVATPAEAAGRLSRTLRGVLTDGR